MIAGHGMIVTVTTVAPWPSHRRFRSAVFGFVAPTISSDTEINKNEGTAEATYGLVWRKQLTKATSRHCSDTRSLSRAGAGAYGRRR